MRRLLATTVLLAAAAGARAQDAPAPAGDGVEAAVARLLAAGSRAERVAAAAQVAAAKPEVARVAALLAAGPAHAGDAAKGWQRRTRLGPDGVARAWLLFVPEDYDAAKRYPLWVDLHGAVARQTAPTHEELEGIRGLWGEEAAARGFLLALPGGQAGAEWWSETGAGNVLGLVRDVKREYSVDGERVVVTGFSDGGSGAYYLALVHPTPFAAFVPLNGQPAVAGIGGLQVHLRNLLNKPVYAVNTDLDSLYPSAQVRPVAQAVKDLGAPFTWHEVRGFGHDPGYLPAEREAIRAWVAAQRRVPHPDRVVWEGTEDAPASRVHWIDRVRVVDREETSAFPDVDPSIPPGRVLLGVTLDPEAAGPGVLVGSVGKGSAAAAAGVLARDRILALDGTEISDARALRALLGKKAHGDAFRLRLRRGEEDLEKEGRFPEATAEPAFPRSRPFGTVDVRRAGNAFDATCANVAGFDLLLGVGAADPGQPVVVRVNGKEAFRGRVPPDLSVLLDYAVEDEDPDLLFWGRVHVEARLSGPGPR